MENHEKEIFKFWQKNNIYEKVKNSGGKKFYFLDGPPYATGSIHIGTAWNKILKDVYIRFWRMMGYDVWDQPGYDTHGLPIEKQVEKQLGIKTKPEIEKIGIEKFIQECKNFATKYIDVMNNQFSDLGVWMNWQKPYLTLDNEYIEGAWHTFKIGYEKGLLYHGLYSVHVCPLCETAVAYNEIEYQKVTDNSIYVKFPVSENEFLVIWTTTPWTIPSNTGIMVKPDAEYVKVKCGGEILIIAKNLLENLMKKFGINDYKIIESLKGSELEGIKYKHPLKDFLPFQIDSHRVILSDQFVTLDEGSGLVHTAPGHGEEDFKVGQENNLPVINPLNLNGEFKEGKYAGIKARDANSVIIEDLRKRNFLIGEENITHDYPMCWRCNSYLLQMAVPQWFFKVTEIRKKLIDENKKVNWYPEWAKKRFNNWLQNLGDWPISRQRYWGIPLPIWTCEKCESVKVIGSTDELPFKPEDLHRPYIDKIELECKCKGKMKRTPDVLDVWFDSGLAGWASLGYPKNKKTFENLWPIEFETEGPDQIRGWWNSQLITSVITFNEKPFKNILFHGFVLDAHGIKMSKSKGNVIDPFKIIEEYGRDVLRLYLTSSPPWDDFYFKSDEVKEIAKSFIVIENAFNFVKTYVPKSAVKNTNFNVEDKWILSRLNSLIEKSTKNMKSYNAHKTSVDLYSFLINDFSRWYIKLIRNRVWPTYDGDDKEAAFFTLKEVASKTALMLAPFCPFLTEHIYQNILSGKEETIHLENWPEAESIDHELENKMKFAQSIVETANAIRHEQKIKSRWPLSRIVIESNEKLDDLENVVKNMCNVKKIEYLRKIKRFSEISEKHSVLFQDKKENLPSKEFDSGVVFLDTKMDDELKKESVFREVVRKIQTLRKKEKLVVEDKINLFISDENLKEFEQLLKKEVGAEKILFGKKGNEKLNVFGKEISIGIEKYA